MAEFLLSKKADPNAQDVGGGRPIHWAAYQNSRELVDLLLDYKADINAPDFEGRTPLDAARKGHHKEMIDYLKGKGAVPGVGP